MKFKFGRDEGNSGALIRWGKYLDNGIWYRTRRFKKLWGNWKIMKGYLDCGFFVIQYGN